MIKSLRNLKLWPTPGTKAGNTRHRNMGTGILAGNTRNRNRRSDKGQRNSTGIYTQRTITETRHSWGREHR